MTARQVLLSHQKTYNKGRQNRPLTPAFATGVMRMNSRISCPACSGDIVAERFMAPLPSRAAWYKFERQDYRCPHCGVALTYDRKTNILIAVIGLLVTALTGLVVMGELPVFAIGIAPSLLFIWFFKARRLVVRSAHNKPVHPSADALTD